MASSSDNLTIAAFEPFGLFRHSFFPDSWISEAYARDTETLTRALQSTLSNFDPSSFISDNSLFTNSDLLNLISSDSTATTPTLTASNISTGSDFDTAPPPPVSNKRRRTSTLTNPGGGGGGGDAIVKDSKRKSRASKRSQTTFITADPANFRQMVQQVTGVRFCNSQLPVVPVLKPEPQRLTNRFHGAGAGGCLPTLDTSAFLLDHHHQQQQQQQMVMGSASGSGSGSFAQTVLGDGGSGAGLDLDCISSFPTLESFHGKLCDI